MIPHLALIGKILILAADLFYHVVWKEQHQEAPDLTRIEESIVSWKRKQLAKKLRKVRKLKRVNLLEDDK